MAKKSKKNIEQNRYGIGEWYGRVVANLAPAQLNELAVKSSLSPKTAAMPCPFRQASDPGAICNKKGGVCSLQLHNQDADGKVTAIGHLVTMCPSQFWQDNNVFRWVGEVVIGTSKPTLVKEVGFLESVLNLEEENKANKIEADSDEEQGFGDEPSEQEQEINDDVKESVGRIDTILVDPDNSKKWCALELQAVYFSGKGMPSHLEQYTNPEITGLVFADENRRPDFRSSGPKRLMPQLQTKVPTLRRWGKKMAVVVDKSFFKSLGPISEIPHLSNADIAWFVVSYDVETGAMALLKTVYSTLESSVDALTAGIPRSLDAFEGRLDAILLSPKKSMKKKIIYLK